MRRGPHPPPPRRPPPRPPPHLVLILVLVLVVTLGLGFGCQVERLHLRITSLVEERACCLSQRLTETRHLGSLETWCLDIIYILLVTAEQVLHGRRHCVWGDRRVFPNLFTGHSAPFPLIPEDDPDGSGRRILSFSPQGFGRRKKRKINQQVNFSVQWHSGHRGPSRRSSEEDLVPRGPVMAAFG